MTVLELKVGCCPDRLPIGFNFNFEESGANLRSLFNAKLRYFHSFTCAKVPRFELTSKRDMGTLFLRNQALF